MLFSMACSEVAHGQHSDVSLPWCPEGGGVLVELVKESSKLEGRALVGGGEERCNLLICCCCRQ